MVDTYKFERREYRWEIFERGQRDLILAICTDALVAAKIVGALNIYHSQLTKVQPNA